MQTVGVPVSQDTYSGENWGAYVSTSAINPTNWTRSYSRSGYLDPLPPRSNYDVLANAYVTRLIFNSSSLTGNLTADSVEYSPDDGASKLTVKVNKEVILAGGSVGSPAVLLYSGVGPTDVLNGAGVTVVSELPGVGHHLQDHLVSWRLSVHNCPHANRDRALQCNSVPMKLLLVRYMPPMGLRRYVASLNNFVGEILTISDQRSLPIIRELCCGLRQRNQHVWHQPKQLTI